MSPRDIPEVALLEKKVFQDPWPRAAYIQELYFNPHARYFVLEVKAEPRERTPGDWLRSLQHQFKIHGYAGMRVEGEEGHISTLAVHPRWRGCGFGELLLINAIRQALDMGAERITLEVRVSNHVAQRLYAKYGFQELRCLPRYYRNGEAAVLMEVDVQGEEYRLRLDARHQAVITRINAALQGQTRGHKEDR
jgi:ribosomal-protein-alanine N-acetyltransferase